MKPWMDWAAVRVVAASISIDRMDSIEVSDDDDDDDDDDAVGLNEATD